MRDPLHPVIQLIESRTGLAVGSLLRGDVAHIIERLAAGDVHTWTQKLQSSGEDNPVWQELLASFTIGETYFMRDALHFKLLREKLLPPIILQRRQQGELRLALASVGCSTGEEPYSLATTLHEFLPDFDRWDITIIGLDINAQALEQARRAVYRLWSFRNTNETFLRRYFNQHRDQYELRADIRQMVTFMRGNIINPPQLPRFDVIFCRNILLYFTAEQVRQAEENLWRCLNNDGWLILGSAEALRTRRDRWLITAFPNAPLYQKTRKRQTQTLRTISTITKTRPLVTLQDTPTADCASAIHAIRMGDLDHAERLLGQILAETPKDPHAHTLLAFIFANRKAYPEALAHLDSALKEDPAYGDAHYLRAVIHNENGRQEVTVKSLQAALYYQREHLPSMLLLGNLLVQKGDLPRAHKLWAKARDAASRLPEDVFISDFSEVTAQQYIGLMNSQLDE